MEVLKLSIDIDNPRFEELRAPIQTGKMPLRSVKYFSAKLHIGTHIVDTVVNAVEFFFKDQILKKSYTINYDLSKFLENNLLEAHAIISNAIPVNVLTAIELALIKYYNKTKTSVFSSPSECKINYLYEDGLKFKAESIYKFKVYPKNLHSIDKKINEALSSDSIVRIDCNESLSLSEFEDFISRLDQDRLNKIDYIEEPLDNLSNWSKSRYSKLIDLAVDESFSTESDVHSSAKVIILKPGSNISVFEFLKLRRTHNTCTIILTSSFEPPELFNLVTQLASLENNAHGLSTFNFFKNDLNFYKEFDKIEDKLIAFPIN